MDYKKLKGLVEFQRNFRFIRQELVTLSKKIIFFKKCLVSMTDNLQKLNSLKIYENDEYGYIVFLKELSEIKKKVEKLPDELSMADLKNTTINNISCSICEIQMLLIKYMNHIATDNLELVLELFVGRNGIMNMTENDKKRLNVLCRIFNPICIWDSYYHKTKVEYNKENSDKRQIVSKEILETLMDNKKSGSSSVIIGDISLPGFLKNLTEIVIKEKKSNKPTRVINYNHMEALCIFDNTEDKIKLIKNYNSLSLIEDRHGMVIYIRIQERIFIIQGLIRDDILDIYKSNNFIEEQVKEIKKYFNYDIITVPKGYKSNFINVLTIRDILVCSHAELGTAIKKKYNDYKLLKGKSLKSLVNEFLLASKYRKLDILNMLLLGNETDNKVAFILYDVLKMKDKKGIHLEIYNSLHYMNKIKLENAETTCANDEENLYKIMSSDISYEKRITLMNTNENIKAKAVEKLKSFKNNLQGDSKAQSWLDGLLEIPFGVYKENRIMGFKNNFIDKLNKTYPDTQLFSNEQINRFIKDKVDDTDSLALEWETYHKEKMEYIENVHQKLDQAVYGHKEAKTQLERIFAQWINGESKGAILGLLGPPGTGKTSLAKNGLSKCLMDDTNNSRPFVFLPIGGSVNGSTLVGHNYTYVGSTWGRIVDGLIQSGCMNPIIFIDEVDKVSKTEHGKEIISILTHLTDSTQNDSFEDKYFSGVPLDLSKALIIFSFNDLSLIDPILRDRITTIEVKAYNIEEKIHIIKDYMLPEILKDTGFSKDEIIFTEDVIEYIVNTFTNEAGVRKVKEKLIEIVRDINLKMFTTNKESNNISIPFTVTEEYVGELFQNKPKMRIKKININPEVGLVNGLYATTTGIGGLTVIQVMKYPSEKMLDLTLTGQQGDVMKESAEYALRIAYSLLTKEEQDSILEAGANKKNFGLHIHTPDAATKKDGPSAGAAMTLAIYSVLTNKKVNNTVALTGEIDLWKNVTAIGGVYAKLSGAKKAGVKKALIPHENLEDLEILRQEGISPESDNFKVETIKTIKDVFDNCLI